MAPMRVLKWNFGRQANQRKDATSQSREGQERPFTLIRFDLVRRSATRRFRRRQILPCSLLKADVNVVFTPCTYL